MYGREAEFDRTLERFRPMDVLPDANDKTPAGINPREQQKVRPQGDWWKRAHLGDFFRVPNPLHRSGIAAQIGPYATALYLGLLDQAARNGSIRFKVGDRKLGANTGIAERTIVKWRTVLVDAGLIRYSTLPGHSPVYELLVINATEVPFEKRPRSVKKPRGRSVQSHPQKEVDPWDGLPQILRGTTANYARPHAKYA